MSGVVGQEIGSESDEELVAGRVLQHDVHPYIVGEYTVAQGLDGLVVLHHFGLLYVFRTNVVRKLVVLSFAQVEPFHGEAADGFALVFYLPVFLYVYSGQLLEHVFQVVVTIVGVFCQVVYDGVASLRYGWPLYGHFL